MLLKDCALRSDWHIVWLFICKGIAYSEMSATMVASEGVDLGKCSSIGFGNSFSFKFVDSKGRVHRFFCGKYHHFAPAFRCYGLHESLERRIAEEIKRCV